MFNQSEIDTLKSSTTHIRKMNTREEFVENLKSKIDDWNSEIEQLEARGRESSEKAKQEIKVKLAELRSKRRRASEKLEEVESATSDAWESLKIGAMLVWEDITDTVTATKESFQEGLHGEDSDKR